jgi:hypothetical protein
VADLTENAADLRQERVSDFAEIRGRTRDQLSKGSLYLPEEGTGVDWAMAVTI